MKVLQNIIENYSFGYGRLVFMLLIEFVVEVIRFSSEYGFSESSFGPYLGENIDFVENTSILVPLY